MTEGNLKKKKKNRLPTPGVGGVFIYNGKKCRA